MNSFETNSTDIDVSKCEIVHIEDSEMLPNILPLNEYLFDQPRTGNIMLEQPKDFEHVEIDILDGHNTTLSLPEVLTLPPTPRRSIKHRNYKTNFHPVLTAGERTEAIR
uniref:Uncharacterized protein n=1 Tax=Anopheles gambiae TaxID=7165 RepID=A0A1S4H539_ANOGA